MMSILEGEGGREEQNGEHTGQYVSRADISIVNIVPSINEWHTKRELRIYMYAG